MPGTLNSTLKQVLGVVIRGGPRLEEHLSQSDALVPLKDGGWFPTLPPSPASPA